MITLRRLIFSVTIFILILSCQSPGTIVIVDNGKPVFQIVIPDKPAPEILKAAQELQSYILSMSGAQLPIQKLEDMKEQPSVMIGLFKEINILQHHEIAYGSDEGNIYISGGRPQDVLFAAYTFLENILGCRFYAPDAETIPTRKTISVPAGLQYSYIPPITTRTVHSRLYYKHPEFADKRKATHEAFPGYVPVARVHTFNHFLPPSQYYDLHPEYYALRDSKRLPTQLCLTNREVLSIVIDSVTALIKEYPDRDIISVSQNDNQQYCKCENCSALNDLEKSPAGSIINFVNQVAEVFPDKTISTLAYQYSRKAPAYLIPADNVLITLCSIECDRSAPIFEKCTEFTRDLEAWGAITENIRIWDYTTQFTNFLAPFPNIRTLQPNIRLFEKNNARWVFEQHSNHPSALFELRSYLTAKLLWDPSSNVDSLLHVFTRSYYQEAGPYIEKYVDTIHDVLADDPEFFLFLYGDPSEAFDSYLNPELLKLYESWFNEAEQIVADRPEILFRVKKARLGVDYAILEMSRQQSSPGFTLTTSDETGHLTTPEKLAQRLTNFEDVTKRADITLMNEMGYTVSEYLKAYRDLLIRAGQPNIALNHPVTLLQKPKKYAGENPQTLTDGAYGGSSFYSNWLGFEGNDLEAIIDLEDIKAINEISTTFLQVINHLVFFPVKVSFYSSVDGRNYKLLGDIGNAAPLTRASKVNDTQNFDLAFPKISARYIKIKAKNIGTPPIWHHGAGLPAWIFADEVMVR